MGLYQPDEDEDMSSFEELARKARAGSTIPVKLVKDLGKKDPFITVPETEGLAKVVEVFGSGVHRIAVVREGTNQVIGMISQLRLISFFWEHGRSFPTIDQLYPRSLRELNIGSGEVISIKYVFGKRNRLRNLFRRLEYNEANVIVAGTKKFSMHLN